MLRTVKTHEIPDNVTKNCAFLSLNASPCTERSVFWRKVRKWQLSSFSKSFRIGLPSRYYRNWSSAEFTNTSISVTEDIFGIFLSEMVTHKVEQSSQWLFPRMRYKSRWIMACQFSPIFVNQSILMLEKFNKHIKALRCGDIHSINNILLPTYLGKHLPMELRKMVSYRTHTALVGTTDICWMTIAAT